MDLLPSCVFFLMLLKFLLLWYNVLQYTVLLSEFLFVKQYKVKRFLAEAKKLKIADKTLTATADILLGLPESDIDKLVKAGELLEVQDNV